jgi:integrase
MKKPPPPPTRRTTSTHSPRKNRPPFWPGSKARHAIWCSSPSGTGLRTSELVALNWGDVDFIRGIVRISKASTQAAKDTVETTKTRAGVRDVRLLAPALAALKDQRAFTFLNDAEIFQNPRNGKRWTGDQPIRKTMWAPALKRAGIRYRYPYQTRHTYASMMLSAGEHPMWVAQQMGHSDWAMIRKTYGPLDAGHRTRLRRQGRFDVLGHGRRFNSRRRN